MNDEWQTPPDLFYKLDDEFQFTMDGASSDANTWCPKHYTQERSFLAPAVLDEIGPCDRVWLNPPYSRGLIGRFMTQAKMLADAGTTVVTLTRFDPSAVWFQRTVDAHASEVRMLAHRVKFVGADAAYPFPCCVAVFEHGVRWQERYHIWSWRKK